MVKSVPRYSVVIPTRNRLEYLKHAIHSTLSQACEHAELIVSDNYSSDGTWDYLATLQDPRLRVIRPPMPLAMTDHFEFVLTQTKGDWITMLGDDDGLLPYFFELLDHLRSSDRLPEVLLGPRAYFFWPGIEDLYGKAVVAYDARNQVELVGARKSLHSLVYGEAYYFNFPQFYTGTVFHRGLLDRIKRWNKKGLVFSSVIPDASSTASILTNTEKFMQIGLPLAWVGSSPKSNGAQSTRATKKSASTQAVYADFKALNKNSAVTVDERFRTIYEISNPQLYFLEALYQASVTSDSNWHLNLNNRDLAHKIFLGVYRDYQNRQLRGEPVQAYLQLFEDNGLSLSLLERLDLKDKRYAPLRRSLTKLKNIGKPLLNWRSHHVRYRCKEAGVHPTIESVNGLFSTGSYREKIQQIIADT